MGSVRCELRALLLSDVHLLTASQLDCLLTLRADRGHRSAVTQRDTSGLGQPLVVISAVGGSWAELNKMLLNIRVQNLQNSSVEFGRIYRIYLYNSSEDPLRVS